MPKKSAAAEIAKTDLSEPAPSTPAKSKKIPKLAKKDKHRLPRKEKKAKQKAALKA
jgi:hypothetical protein